LSGLEPGTGRVDEELQNIMKDIHARCIEYIERVEGLYPYRKGANVSSFKKLADTMVAYGIK
jgi:Glutamate dehydrogenase/leucine dehydrogenase